MPTKAWIEVPIEQEVWGVPDEGYSPHFFPPEGDYLLFYFTEESFLRVLSALINGAALTYPDTWLQVVWDFLRSVEYPVSACQWLTNLIETCDDVRESITGVVNNAINNNETTKDALANWLFSDLEVLNRLDERYAIPVLTPETAGMNILLAGQCDPDYIFNQATTLVDTLNTLSVDIHEAVEVGTNQFERWAIITSALPGVGQVIPADEGFAAVNQIVEELWEDYVGAYDAALRNDIRCELFCLAQNECTLSLDMAIAYYEGKIGGLSLEDPVALLNDIFSFIANGDFPGDAPVYAMHLLVLALIRAAQDVFGIDFANMYLEVMAAGDTPNNDWETICPDCPTEVCQDLTTGANGWFGGLEGGTPSADFGVWISGEGMAPDQTTGGWNVGINEGDMPSGNVTALKFVFNEPVSELWLARWGSDDFKIYAGSPSTEIIMSGANTSGYFPFDSSLSSVRITTSTNTMPTSTRLIEVCYTIG